eukprot:4558635-Pyramimonas_sp.AAC.2
MESAICCCACMITSAVSGLACPAAVARRTVRVLSPIWRPFSPAHAMSTTIGSSYTANLRPTARRHVSLPAQPRSAARDPVCAASRV